MITNHPTDTPDRVDIGLNQALYVLEQKQKKASEERTKYQELINQLLLQEKEYAYVIRVLRSEFPVAQEPKNPVDPQDSPQKDTPDQEPSQVPLEWEKPAEFSWFDLIREAIRSSGNLLTHGEVTDFWGMDKEAKDKHRKSISGALSNYRASEHLIAITAYLRTSNGSTIPVLFTGLPEFFADLPRKRLKEEFQEKFEQKIRSQGLYLSEVESIRS